MIISQIKQLESTFTEIVNENRKNTIRVISCKSNKNTCDFLELMLSFSLMPRIMNPTRITLRSQTLIDNIFYNEVQHKIIAGNITTDISDHLTKFIAVPGRHNEHLNEDIYRRNYKF